jgi:hypothetical protein
VNTYIFRCICDRARLSQRLYPFISLQIFLQKLPRIVENLDKSSVTEDEVSEEAIYYSEQWNPGWILVMEDGCELRNPYGTKRFPPRRFPREGFYTSMRGRIGWQWWFVWRRRASQGEVNLRTGDCAPARWAPTTNRVCIEGLEGHRYDSSHGDGGANREGMTVHQEQIVRSNWFSRFYCSKPQRIWEPHTNPCPGSQKLIWYY